MFPHKTGTIQGRSHDLRMGDKPSRGLGDGISQRGL